MNYYLICFLLSAFLTVIHVFRYQNRYGLHFSLMYIFATFANLGYWQIYDATELNQAILANKIAYVGGCFSTLSLMMCIFSVCKVAMNERFRALLYLFTFFIYGTCLTVGYNDMFYKNVSLVYENGRYRMIKEYAFFHTLFYVMLVLYVVICLVVLVIGFRKKKEVSIVSVQLMFFVMIINFASFFVGRKLFEVELIAASYVITELVVLLITRRLVLYNVDEMVARNMAANGLMGAALFDENYRFFGCNAIAGIYYPPLGFLSVDKKVDRNNDNLTELIFWLDKVKYGENLEVIYQWKNRVYKVSGEPFHVGHGKKGISLVFTDYTEESNRADELVKVATKAKSDVLAQMSHEIRTPINAILGMNEMILRTTTDLEVKQYSEDVKKASDTLLEIVNDILDFSKLDAGKVEVIKAEYNLADLVKDVTNMFADRARKKGLYFTTTVNEELPASLQGDDVKIRQILVNLLSNAIKYTQKGMVELEISGNVIGDKVRLHFHVKDTGIGIKPEDRNKLFQEFERIEEKANRGIEGTGLGMSIIIRLLKMMDSELLVDSVYGEGSQFSFDLEQDILGKESVAEYRLRKKNMLQEMEHRKSFTAPKAKILVVDDYEMNRKVFKALLRDSRIHILEADSGEECLNLIQKQHFDIIFLDHMMPGMDGIETLHRIKELPDSQCKMTPVIVLTANVVHDAESFYIKEGFDDFLGKPFHPDDLESMIVRLLPEEYVSFVNIKYGSTDIAEEISLPVIDGIDWNSALSHFNDKKTMLTMIRDVGISMSHEAEKLSDCYTNLQTDDFSKEETYHIYRTQIHDMKNTAYLIGATVLGDMAKNLEDAAIACDKQLIENVTDDFLEEWSLYSDRLKELCSDEPLKEKVKFDRVISLLESLKKALEEMDIEEMDFIISEMDTIQFEDDLKGCFMKLKSFVVDLDDEKGIPCIDEFLDRLSVR